MRILVVGAGVIGSLYAAKLALSDHDVTMLARGQRLAQIAEAGLVIEDARSGGARESVRVSVIDALAADDRYDLVLVAVRNNQVDEILPMLRENVSPSVLFMVNSAEGPAGLTEALGADRVLLGFPGAGGTRVDGVIRYTIICPFIQLTTVGEAIRGPASQRVRSLVRDLRRAGFPSTSCSDMEGWLKTHVALVSPIANVVYAKDGDMRAAAHDRALMRSCALAIRENLQAVAASGVRPTPRRLGLLRFAPTSLMSSIAGMLLDTDYADLVVARHANSARDEMEELARQMAALAKGAGVLTPSADALAAHI